MAITKPPVLPAWADAGDKVQPSNAELSVGWPVSSTPPSRQRFNWVLNYVANAVRYFSRRGMVDYDAAETYMTGDRIIGDDGKTYRSLIDNNTAQTPSTSPTKWERWGFSQSDLGANSQTQPYTAFTTTGATGAFVLTPSPAIAAYAANQRFRVKFHVAGNGSDTLAVSGLAAKNLKQYDSTGAKNSPVLAANQLVDVEYDGVDFVILDPLPPSVQTPASIQGAFKNLIASSTGLNANVSVTADEISVESVSNIYQTLRNVNLTIAGTSSGVANGLDTGALAASTWYSVWVIWNGATVSGLLSLSATTPTLPAGYTHKARIGWIRTDGTVNKYPLSFKQFGRDVTYSVVAGSNVAIPIAIATGVVGTFPGTLVAVGVSNFIPTTAAKAKYLFNAWGGSGTGITASPDAVSGNGAYGSSTNPAYVYLYNTTGVSGQNAVIELPVLSTNIYIASNGTNGVFIVGWTDNI